MEYQSDPSDTQAIHSTTLFIICVCWGFWRGKGKEWGGAPFFDMTVYTDVNLVCAVQNFQADITPFRNCHLPHH